MRLLLAVVLASAVPVFAPRSCAGPPPMRVNGVALVLPPGPGELRARCLAPGEDVNAVEVPDQTFPVTPGGELWVAGPCALVVYRRDGGLWARSPVEHVARGLAEVAVRLPEGPIGGIGIAFGRGPGGVEVRRVHAGSPADGVLRVGDRILGIDGHPTAGMSDWDFIERGTGPVGSPVLLEVDGPGGPQRRSLVRRPIPEPPAE